MLLPRPKGLCWAVDTEEGGKVGINKYVDYGIKRQKAWGVDAGDGLQCMLADTSGWLCKMAAAPCCFFGAASGASWLCCWTVRDLPG